MNKYHLQIFHIFCVVCCFDFSVYCYRTTLETKIINLFSKKSKTTKYYFISSYFHREKQMQNSQQLYSNNQVGFLLSSLAKDNLVPQLLSFFFFFRHKIELRERFQPTNRYIMCWAHSQLPSLQKYFFSLNFPFDRDKLKLIKFHKFLICHFLMLLCFYINIQIGSYTPTYPYTSIFKYQISSIYLLSWNLLKAQIKLYVLIHFKQQIFCTRFIKFVIYIYILNKIQKMLQYFSQERAVQDSLYTTQDFLFRWKKLERVIAKQGVDGLLIATGLDARDCVHSAYIFNWLFLGLSGKSITINKYLDTVYSEMIVIVSSKGSSIFITPQARNNLQNLIYSIPNCSVFCPTQKQYNNKQLLDTLKIAQFYAMSSKMAKIGVFLGQNEDVKMIQKWPLVQSYALEPVGRTFFTLKHQAVNLGAKITPLFRNLDKHSLKNLVSRTAYSLQGHVKGALTTLQLKSQQQRQKISQTSLQEPLQEAVDIGLFQSGNEQYKGLVRVLFGLRTQNATASSPDVTVASQKADHFTVEHFDPYTKMKVWRTYFLNLNIKTLQQVSLQQKQQQESFIVKNLYKLQQVQNSRYHRQYTLISLYVSLVQSVLQSISLVAKDYRNLNNQFIGKFVLSKINQTAKDLYGQQIFTNNDIVSQIQSFDSFGQPRVVDFKDSISFKLTSTFYIVKLRLKNVICPGTKEKLGSLIFSESFLIQEGCYLLLTKRTPYFDFWKCEPYNQILSQLNPNFEFEKLGKALHQEGYRNRIFIPSQKLSAFHLNIPILNVKYFFHEKGLRIYNDKIGWQVILYNQINNLTMVNKIPGEWVLMKTKKNFVFDCLENNILAIQFKGKPFNFLIQQTKSKEHPLQLTFIDEIPPLLSQNWYFCNQVLKKPIKDGAVLFQQQILINDFLWSFIEAKQLMIINQMKDIKMAVFRNIYQTKVQRKKQSVPVPQGKQSIIIINGTYGAGKYNLAKTLKRFGPAQIPCQIFRVSSDNLFKKIPAASFVQMIQEHIKEFQRPKEKSIIVIIPSWLNSLQALPLLQQKFHIRSILSKVNVSNFFSTKNGLLTQNILTFCLPGYSQNVVVDAFAQEQSLINQVIKIVGSFNRESNVFRSTNCLLTTGQCSDIVLNNSFCGQYQTFLRQKYGAFYTFEQLSQLEINYIQFKLPLHDLQAFKTLKKSQGYLIDRASVLRELLPKKKQAQNSKDELMMGLYFLEEVMAVVRRRQKVPYLRSIKGIANYKPENKPATKIQINWANNELKQEQLKNSSRPLGFSIMSKRYNQLEVRNFIESLSFKKILFGDIQIMRSTDSLLEDDIKNIEKWAIQNQRYLDQGYYYDGYVLRNADGFLVERHPNLQKAIQGWLAQQNARVAKFNGGLRQKWNEYVANYKDQ